MSSRPTRHESPRAAAAPLTGRAIILSMNFNQRAVPGPRCYLVEELYRLPYSPRVLAAV
jgi:hypothetical protein